MEQHEEITSALHEQDKRLIRVETRLETMVQSERVLAAKVEEIVKTLAGLVGEQQAIKRLIPIGLAVTTIILTLVQVFLG